MLHAKINNKIPYNVCKNAQRTTGPDHRRPEDRVVFGAQPDLFMVTTVSWSVTTVARLVIMVAWSVTMVTMVAWSVTMVAWSVTMITTVSWAVTMVAWLGQ